MKSLALIRLVFSAEVSAEDMRNFLDLASEQTQGFTFEDVTDESDTFNDTYVVELRGPDDNLASGHTVKQTWIFRGLRLDFNGDRAVLDIARRLFEAALEKYESRRPRGVLY